MDQLNFPTLDEFAVGDAALMDRAINNPELIKHLAKLHYDLQYCPDHNFSDIGFSQEAYFSYDLDPRFKAGIDKLFKYAVNNDPDQKWGIFKNLFIGWHSEAKRWPSSESTKGATGAFASVHQSIDKPADSLRNAADYLGCLICAHAPDKFADIDTSKKEPSAKNSPIERQRNSALELSVPEEHVENVSQIMARVESKRFKIILRECARADEPLPPQADGSTHRPL